MIKLNKKIKNIYILVLSLLLIVTFLFITILSKKAMPILINYASVQTKRISLEVLRNVSLEKVNNKIREQDLLLISKNNEGEIETIDFNTAALNEILVVVASGVKKSLKEVEQGMNLPEEIYKNIKQEKLKKGIVYEVPLGSCSGNVFFSNMGPKIPVKIEYSGNVGVDIKTRVSGYGINSALIEVFVLVEVTQKTILPFQSKDTKLSTEIPIIMKVIKGNTPNYLSGINGTYSLPIN